MKTRTPCNGLAGFLRGKISAKDCEARVYRQNLGGVLHSCLSRLVGHLQLPIMLGEAV